MDKTTPSTGKTRPPRRKPAEGPRHYHGNPELAEEAEETGDRVQGSDGQPVTGQP